MKMLRHLLAAALTLAPVASATALDRVLPTPRIKDNGDVRLSDDLRIGTYQGGKYTATPDRLAIQGPGSTGDISDMTATTRSPTDNSNALATTGFVQQLKGQRVFTAGVAIDPYVDDPKFYTGSWVAGENKITVMGDSSPIKVGMSVWAYPSFVYGTLVTEVSGQTVFVTDPATTSGSSDLTQFGQFRWSNSSNLLAQQAAFDSLYLGSAARGNTIPWLSYYYAGGYQSSNDQPLISVSPTGRYSSTFAVRSGDAGPTGPQTQSWPVGILAVHDSTRVGSALWGLYSDVIVPAGIEGRNTFGEEAIIANNSGFSPRTTPHRLNPPSFTVLKRLGCGRGDTTFDIIIPGQPHPPVLRGGVDPCSSALEIVNEGNGFRTGILFSSDAVNPDPGAYADVISMAPTQALTWWGCTGVCDGYPANTQATTGAVRQWQVTSIATTAVGNNLKLGDSSAAINTDWLVGSGANFLGSDKMIAVGGATSSAIGTMVGGAAGAFIASSATGTAVTDIRANRTLALGAGDASANLIMKPNKSVHYPPLAALPGSPTEGDCAWDGPAHKLKCFDGTSWQAAW